MPPVHMQHIISESKVNKEDSSKTLFIHACGQFEAAIHTVKPSKDTIMNNTEGLKAAGQQTLQLTVFVKLEMFSSC